MSTNYNILVPTAFGRGCINEIGARVKALGCSKVIYVYDKTLPQNMVDLIGNSLDAAGVEYVSFSNVLPNLPDYTVKEACDIAEAAGGVNGVIGFGGGSAMDTAKCINIMLNNPWPMSQYYRVNGGVIENSGYPLILVPTTAGTGAELTVAAVVTDTASDIKRPILSTKCCTAVLAIVDPELTYSMPAKLTAITGYDAFSHAFESYTSDDGFMSPVTDACCLAAMKSIVRCLPLVMHDLGNHELRDELAYASNLAGIGISNAHAHKGHCFAHAIGSLTHAPHGVSVACNLPYIAAYITPAYYDRVKTVVREVFGVDVADDISPDALGSIIADEIRRFDKTIGCPTLKDYGATRQEVLDSEELIMADPLLLTGRVQMDRQKVRSVLNEICDFYGLQ